MPATQVARRADSEATRRAVVAGSVGNFIEWYEFGAYGYFATIIASKFFATKGASDLEALIATYASFAIAFFFRPIGSWFFGRLGDRIGRRPTLIIVLLLMSGATALIGLLPTRVTLGAAAPVVLTLVRILQGLSAGGEFGGAVSVMTEFAPSRRRGLYGAWQSLTVAFGLLAGAAIAAILATVLSSAALTGWGWRVPFLLALPLGLIALWLRLRLDETPNFRRVENTETSTARVAPVTRPSAGQVLTQILLGILRLMGWSAAGYTYLVVMPGYLQTALKASFQQALIATVLANAGFALTIIPAGILSDRVGRKWVMLAGTILLVVFALPLLNILQAPGSMLGKGIAVFVAGAMVGMIAGPGPAMLSEMFPTSVRYTGLGLAYSLSNAVFSGSAGLIITSLVKGTKNVDIPAYYVMIVCAISLIGILTLRRDDHLRDLED